MIFFIHIDVKNHSVNERIFSQLEKNWTVDEQLNTI